MASSSHAWLLIVTRRSKQPLASRFLATCPYLTNLTKSSWTTSKDLSDFLCIGAAPNCTGHKKIREKERQGNVIHITGNAPTHPH